MSNNSDSTTQSVQAPNHIGFILDGNRRWARAQGLKTLEGHRAGYENLKTIVRAAFDHGAEVVSAYIFSTENWNRSSDEVKYLLDLTFWLANHELKNLEKEQIKVVFLGTMERVSGRLKKAIQRAEDRTKDFTKGTLAICFNYGGQQEIVNSLKQIIEKGIESESIDVRTIEENLYHPEIPPVDLVIRTSGEQRLSNFMLWRVAYSELIFCSKYWPDYKEEDFEHDLMTYNSRQRRFGK